MNMLRDIEAAEIKEPFLDRPEDACTASMPISEGTSVSLSYHGKQLSARVTAIERLGTAFVGCIRSFPAQEAPEDDVSPGDHIRFRLGDVCGFD